MRKRVGTFNAVISSDWSECLSPSGPFDFIAFHFPQLAPELDEVFRSYTGNLISLGDTCLRIKKILPRPVAPDMMDAYLDRSFAVYRGVPELIEWCLGKGILFMLNTTGMIGYFQRVFAKGLLPKIPVLSANPMVRYPSSATDPHTVVDLIETQDKGKNTAAVVADMGIPASRVVVMGDSGGDGPHFEWAARAGAFIIGSMTKHSLSSYCRDRDISIRLRVGVSYGEGQVRDVEKEKRFDFMDLVEPLQTILKRSAATEINVP
jgi:2-hydroxy-3-keto-5-methylthiopentenyl-1-phosphate phosphatase